MITKGHIRKGSLLWKLSVPVRSMGKTGAMLDAFEAKHPFAGAFVGFVWLIIFCVCIAGIFYMI